MQFQCISLFCCVVQAGHYTPESSVEHPEAVEQLAEEFARAGADITQTFTFYNRDVGTPKGCRLTVSFYFYIIAVHVLVIVVLLSVPGDKPGFL